MVGFLPLPFFSGYLQAFWRGFSLRRRLASALAAVTCPDVGEDDVLEELDVGELAFDEVRARKFMCSLLSWSSPSQRRTNPLAGPQTNANNCQQPPHTHTHTVLCRDKVKLMQQHWQIHKDRYTKAK